MAYIPNSGSVAGWIQSNNASVITVSQGSIATVIIGGSIAASFTPPANQSVSGMVGASLIGLSPVNVSNFPTTQNISGSVVSFINNTPAVSVQGTVFVSGSVITVGSSAPANQSVSGTVNVLTGSSSVITLVQSSIAAVIIGGSIAASFVPPANQSVSGTVGASIIGLTPVAVTNTPSISGTVNVGNTVTINPPSIYGNISGSVVAFITNTPAVSVQGTVFVSGSVVTVGSSAPANQSVSGAVSVSNFPTTQNVSGSVVATQGTTPWTVTSSIAGGIFPISGSVAAVVTNNVTVVSSIAGGIFPISGSVAATIVGTPNVNVAGSVVAFQGGAPWANTNVGSVITVGQSSVAVVIIGGSILTSSTANQSVSGTIGASIIGTVPVTQVTTPWTISSVYGNVSGSIAGTYTSSTVATTVTGLAMMFKPNVSSSIMTEISPTWPLPITGAVAASISGTVATTLSGNPSISGTVLVNNGSVVAFQGTTPWLIGSIYGNISGSVAATITNTPAVTTGNASVITVGQGSIATVIIGGSIAASFTPPANQSVSGTVQTQVQASVAVVIIGGSILTSSTANQSVSGTVGASIIGQLPAGTAMIGSVVAYQGAIPWTIGSVYGNISGSVAATITNTNVNISGSVVAFVTNNPSVSGTVGASVIGIAPVTLTANTIPATASILVGVTANTNGSVLTTTGYPQAVMQITSGPGASITGQVNFEGTMDGTQFVPIQGYNIATGAVASAAGIESDWAFNVAGLQGMRGRVSNWTVGSITAIAKVSPSDARPLSTYIVGNPSISGTVLIGGQPITVTPNFSSIIAINAGSVVAIPQGSVITVLQSSSIIAINAGSVVALSVGSVITVLQAPSLVGTYAEDAASASGDKGFLVMGARNDTLSSVTSADGDYSSHVVGPAGELIAANSPFTKWVSGTASMLGGTPVTGSLVPIIAAQGASIFTYITGVQIANASGTNAWITLLGATNSVIGFTIAPANGGSNIYYQNGLKTNANAAFSASISAVASVYVSAQGFIAKI